MSLAVGLLLFLALAALAYANGANDVSKGVATLVGSGTSRYRQALVWGQPGPRPGRWQRESFRGH